VALPQLAARVKQQHGELAGGAGRPLPTTQAALVPVVISADRNVRYDSVVRVMDTLQRAGVQRVGLSVRQGS
jgi:biopolymer transport protein TolR